MIEKKIKIPKKDKNLAEFIGIMLGDGNVYTFKRKGVYQIKITTNSITDRTYLIEFISPLVQSLFGLKGSISFEKGCKGINLRLASKRLVYYLMSIGLKEGDKIKNRITMPKWITIRRSLLIACIRGLIDTDGTVFENKKNSNKVNIGFKNNNPQLLKQVRNKLIYLGFHPTKTHTNAFFLCRREEIELFIKRIGFHNYKHLAKCCPASKALVTAPSEDLKNLAESSGQG